MAADCVDVTVGRTATAERWPWEGWRWAAVHFFDNHFSQLASGLKQSSLAMIKVVQLLWHNFQVVVDFRLVACWLK